MPDFRPCECASRVYFQLQHPRGKYNIQELSIRLDYFEIMGAISKLECHNPSAVAAFAGGCNPDPGIADVRSRPADC